MSRETDVVVVGGGPAGVEAALAAAAQGLRVTVLDEAPQAGGQVYRAPPHAFGGTIQRDADPIGVALRQRLAASSVVTCFEHAVWSVSPGFRVDALAPDGPASWTARAVVVATGAQERVVPFPGWTRPGVIGLAGTTIMLKSQGMLPGERTLVAGQGPLLLAVAVGILKAGGQVAGVVDLASPADWAREWRALASRPRLTARGAGWRARLLRAGVPFLYRHAVQAVEEVPGGLRVLLTRVDRHGAPTKKVAREYLVDALAVGNGLTASTDITRLLRAAHHYDALRGGWVPTLDAEFRSSLPGLYVAGDAAGLAGADAAVADGILTGLTVARDLGAMTDTAYRGAIGSLRRRARRARSFGTAMARLMAIRPAHVAAIPAETIVCRCEDVTRAEIDAARSEGAQTANQVKAWTRCGMGPCQGRICGDIVGALLAAGEAPREPVGYFTGRTPLRPLPLNLLAGDVEYTSLKLPPPAPL
ncbi:MAG: FAD-dependent oxidoreductase [Rhodospirillales bacterium]|nr:FAD-dependent oxidoreductase [Rhodospirillales bacterium]